MRNKSKPLPPCGHCGKPVTENGGLCRVPISELGPNTKIIGDLEEDTWIDDAVLQFLCEECLYVAADQGKQVVAIWQIDKDVEAEDAARKN